VHLLLPLLLLPLLLLLLSSRLVMGTRSGDMDPAVPLHMMNTLGLSAKEMDTGGLRRCCHYSNADSSSLLLCTDQCSGTAKQMNAVGQPGGRGCSCCSASVAM
jgi:hypothetical protein